MQKIGIPFALVLLIGVALWSNACFYDSEEDLYGGVNGCDTVGVRYSVEVLNLLENNCYSCHTQNNNIAGIPFETYETLLPLAQNGKLVTAINNQADPMPQSGLMPECDRRVIEAWVNAGAPNN